MKCIEPGHIYALSHLDPMKKATIRVAGLMKMIFEQWLKGYCVLVFRKRNSAMIQHDEEHDGTNTQELLRVAIDLTKIAIDRSRYLNEIQSCNETLDAIAFGEIALGDLRMVLYSYEVRALRRKRAALNKQAGKHVDEGKLGAHREAFRDIPFDVRDIEMLPVGADGHIKVPCVHVKAGDRARCAECGQQWDTNDPAPPACPR